MTAVFCGQILSAWFKGLGVLCIGLFVSLCVFIFLFTAYTICYNLTYNHRRPYRDATGLFIAALLVIAVLPYLIGKALL